jgi:hypothetical protein
VSVKLTGNRGSSGTLAKFIADGRSLVLEGGQMGEAGHKGTVGGFGRLEVLGEYETCPKFCLHT